MQNVRLCLLVFLCGILALPLAVVADRSQSQTVTLILPENRRTVTTNATNVRGVLRQAGVRIERYRRIFPALDSRIMDGMNVFLYPGRDEDGARSRALHNKQLVLPSKALPEGMRMVIQGGKSGLEKGGDVLEEPVSRLVLRGYSDHRKRLLKKVQKRGTMRVLATGYSPHQLDTAPYDDGYSAIGLKAGYGVIAVDPRVIPLGTRLYVEGNGYGIAADVGGDINGKHIDLCFDDREDALVFGRRWTTVHILG